MQHLGIVPDYDGGSDPPETIHSVRTTISCVQRMADEICADPPKTIQSEGVPTSGGLVSPKRRGRGAPPGNLNALKTGRYTRKARILRKQIWEFTSEVASLARLIEAHYGFETSRSRPQKQKWPVMPDDLRRIYRQKART